jgi:hypothetical protein
MAAFFASRMVRVTLALAVVVVVILGIQTARVYHATGELRLTPSQAPPKLHEFGRDYRKDAGTASLPQGAHEIGETPGGGEVFGPRRVSVRATGSPAVVPTVIWVRDDSGHVWTYELVGGP